KPQYPRAEAVVHPQARTETHIEKAIAVHPAKPQVIPKTPTPAASPAAQVRKQESVASSPAKAQVGTSQPTSVSAAIAPSHKQEVKPTKLPSVTSPRAPAVVSQPAKTQVRIDPPPKPAVA